MVSKKLVEVYELFEDELSKNIFEAKVKWYFQGGDDECESILYDYYKTSRIVDLERYPQNYEYVVCGAGNYGKKTIKALLHAGYKVRCILDNDPSKQGKKVEGLNVYSFTQFVVNKELNNNTIVIIDNVRLSDAFFAELFELGFPQSRIYRTKEDIVRTAFGNIYFDLNELNISNEEVFIDAGSFNGDSTIDFINFVGGKYSKIYACEPMADGFTMTQAALSTYENVETHKVALGNKCEDAVFAESFSGLMGSRLGESGDHLETVRIETIDRMLAGDMATFIKMDIDNMK